MSAAQTSFTVIGGFLGAGKTTFVNHLLRNATGRYAVLVNDFGAINVDAGLIAEHAGETLRLTNGCVCCSLNEDFFQTLSAVLDAPEPFDHIFVEASGVGDPQAISDIAVVEPQLTLNAILVLTDAERIAAQISDNRIGDTAARQLRAADLVLLNKVDLVGGGTLRDALKAIREIKPNVRVIQTKDAAIPLAVVESAHAERRPSRFRADPIAHEDRFRRFVYRRDGSFGEEALTAALAGLPASLLRLKGACRVGASPRLLQWVGGRASLTTGPPELDTGDAIELVGIGLADLDEAAIVECLDTALECKRDASATEMSGHEIPS